MTAPLRLGGYSAGDLQLLTAVDGVAVKAIKGLDLLVADAAAQVLLGNAPEGVALDHGVYAVGHRRTTRRRQVGDLHRGHDGVGAALVLVDDRTVAGNLVDIPFLLPHPGGDGLTAVVLRPGDGHQIAGLDFSARQHAI